MNIKFLKKPMCIILSAVIVMLCGCSSGSGSDSGKIDNLIEEANILSISDEEAVSTIYTLDFQDDIYNQIEELKSDEYTFASPLIIANPYRTNTTSLYIYFNMDTEVEISYSITADGYGDFSYTTSGRICNRARVSAYRSCRRKYQYHNSYCDRRGRQYRNYAVDIRRT
ncbi:MAG: aryl-sulfate sulfotransferase N-terminal domain-containing protein [Clostridiales bacterium]|nr:aryl-sulfate sulfotransferase N-terminal domain-containing protein [Clostridiales bacterium]